MSIGAKASAVVAKSGMSIVYLHDLHTRSKNGDKEARREIENLIKSNRELGQVFYAFRTAIDRAKTARRAMTKEEKAKQRTALDPRNGGWERLQKSVGKSPGLALRGGLPSLGKSAK